MITLNCPSCGAEIRFKSKASVFAVCSFCKSTLVRQDMNLDAIGKMADLQDELTPLQVGTVGFYDGKKFEIIGRLKVGYPDGFWNEWYSYFGGDQVGWLAEAQGFYAMCFSAQPAKSLPRTSSLKPGMLVTVTGDTVFEVEDIEQAKCVFSEGELPLNAVQGRESTSVDLVSPEEGMATVEYATDGIRVYVGSYQEFDDFRFTNLRQLDGW